jgi:hypothetical protein
MEKKEKYKKGKMIENADGLPANLTQGGRGAVELSSLPP